MRATARFKASVLAVTLLSVGGCSATPSPSAKTPAITTVEAQKVFERYDQVLAAAGAALDATAIQEVETGILLKTSLAAYKIHREAGTKPTDDRLVRPTFLIPTLAHTDTYPRYFAVLSKWKGREDDRGSSILYFMQTEADGPWKATAGAWVVTEAPKASVSKPASAQPSPTKGSNGIRVTPKVLPDLYRDASGAVELSPSTDSDRAVCDDFAEYLTFSPPNGNPSNNRFTDGSFSSDLVRHYNSWANKNLSQSLSVRTTGERLPAFRFANGGALVACTFERHYRVSGIGSSGTVHFNKQSDTDVLLGGGGKEWRSVEQVSVMTVLFEVPAGESSPATVLACDCHAPQVLSAVGVQP